MLLWQVSRMAQLGHLQGVAWLHPLEKGFWLPESLQLALGARRGAETGLLCGGWHVARRAIGPHLLESIDDKEQGG